MWSVLSVFLCRDDFCWYYYLATYNGTDIEDAFGALLATFQLSSHRSLRCCVPTQPIWDVCVRNPLLHCSWSIRHFRSFSRPPWDVPRHNHVHPVFILYIPPLLIRDWYNVWYRWCNNKDQSFYIAPNIIRCSHMAYSIHSEIIVHPCRSVGYPLVRSLVFELGFYCFPVHL
jgi:hypothetical protein